jgi:hypothetical protein
MVGTQGRRAIEVARRSIACEFPRREGQALIAGSAELALLGRCRGSQELSGLAV